MDIAKIVYDQWLERLVNDAHQFATVEHRDGEVGLIWQGLQHDGAALPAEHQFIRR